MPISNTRPKRKSRGGDTFPEDNGGVGGVGGKKEKENGALVAGKKKKRVDDGQEKPPSKKQKKSKAATMQEDDGFVFRKRTTRSSLAAATSQTQTTATAASSSSDLPPVAPPAPPDPPKRKVTRKSTAAAPQPIVEEPKKTKVKKAFSMDVDEEEQQEVKVVVEKKKEKKGKEKVPAAAAVIPTSPPSRIPKLQGGGGGDGTKVVLPVSDTPIIRRNQQLRQKGGQGNRRSSVGMRGRRASSLMDTGIIAEPHAEIVHEDFFKHIHDELLEPHRMKQLLSWCGRRALTPSGASSDKDANARAVARIIEEEVLADVLSNSELSSWFNREDSQPSTVVKKPNPRNTDNLSKVEECEANLKRLRDEKETWLSLLKPDTKTTLSLSGGRPDVNLWDTSLLQPKESEFASSVASQDLLGSAKRLVKHHCGEIEFQVDQLIDGIHKLHHYGEAADRLAGEILEDAESTLAVREARLRQASGTEALPLQEVLRSLSRMDR